MLSVMVTHQETLQLKVESKFKPHLPVTITPNSAEIQQQQIWFQKGSPVFAAPYRYGYLHDSTQCLLPSCETSKQKHLHSQLLLPLVSHHKAVKYLSHKHCHYSVHFHCPQLSTYSQVLCQ